MNRQIMNQINCYILSEYKDNNLIDPILKNYNNVNFDNKKEIEPYMYEVYRGKFDSLFLSNNYEDTIYWINKVINHENFNKDHPFNKDHFFIKAVNSLLIVYLEKKDRDLLASAEKYFKNIKEQYQKDDNLKNIYMKNTNIFHAIRCNNIFTETSFTVPISIKSLQGKIHILLPEDEPSTVGDPSSEMQEMACKIVNKVIDKYREKTDEYWIKNIYPTMIQGHSIKYRAGEFVFRDIPFYDRGEMIISSEKFEISLTTQNGMLIEDVPLYKKLFSPIISPVSDIKYIKNKIYL